MYIEENSQNESAKTVGCFVTSLHSGSFPGELPHMTFLNNSAVHKGSEIFYGSAVDTCFINDNTSSLFIFQDPTKPSTSLSLPSSVKICMCRINNTLNCNLNNFSVDVYSGSKFSLKIAVFDYNGEIIPSVIGTRLQNESIDGATVLTGGLQMTQRFCTDLNYTLSSYNNFETITLTVVDYDVLHSLKYYIHIISCPLGFTVQDNSPTCKCIPALIQRGVICNIDDQTFEHNGNIWIGTYRSNDTADLSNDTDQGPTAHVLVSSMCPFSYCKLGHIRLMLEEADQQCVSNRSGILCGGCSPGLSTSLGPTNCIDCDDTSGLHTALFVFMFSALGLVLIAFLRLCNLTISQGSANPVMFYASVIHINGTIFFERRETNPLTVFVSWFNLDFGFESCFYNGMDATAKAWLQFVFPLYLWLMIVIIYIASKKSARFVRLMGRHCHSVVLTLLHLSFFKLCRSTIAVLLYTDLQNENGEHIRVWRYNGNINYYSKKHAPLLAFACIMLIFFIIPYMLVMICTPLIVRKGYQVRCINFWKLKPFFDAYTGLYKDRAMFWNGLTTIIFTILLVTSTEVEVMLNLVIIAITSLILVFLNFAFSGIYRRWTLSIVEATIHTNLICVSILSLLYITKSQSVRSAAYTSIAVSLIVFIGVLIIRGVKKLSRVSKTIKRVISIMSQWCHCMSGRGSKSKQYHCCHKSGHKCSHCDKHPYTLDYYLLKEDSTSGYYDTGHRDHILTTAQDEKDFEDLPLFSVPTELDVVQPSVIDHNNLFPNAITFSVVALEDADEEETETEEPEENRKEGVCYPANQTNTDRNIQSEPTADSIPEIHIDIDENAPLLSPCIESPQSMQNYLTFELQEAKPSETSSCKEVLRKASFSLNKFRRAKNYLPLDSDTDATGQRPSQVNLTKLQPLEYLQRLTDPIELAVMDEGDSDEDLNVKPIIYQQCNRSKKAVSMPKKCSKGIQSYFESVVNSQTSSEDNEVIPLLSLRKDKHMWSGEIERADSETGTKFSFEGNT